MREIMSNKSRAPKDKTFKTYSEQVDRLITDKGLVIEDRDAAVDTLKQISYFALVSGYKEPFRDSKTDRYKDGVRFEDIEALYRFDTALSSLILHNLLSCERHLKAAFGYHFAQLYGEGQSAYLNPHNYDWEDKEQRPRIEKMISMLSDSIENAEEKIEYIDHYKTNYNEVPIWILLHSVTFGTLARMYEYAKPELRDVICTEFPSMKARNLSYVLSFLSKMRNHCAHNDPLYNARFKEYLPILSVHRALGLVRDDGRNCKSGQSDAFAALVAMRYMLPDSQMQKLVSRIDSELNEVTQKGKWIQKDSLLKLMGFPNNWKDVATIGL